MNSKKSVLVSGANGQLGRSLKEISKAYLDIDFHFYSSKELDITNREQLEKVMASDTFDFCINCAAYTDVEKAETEKEKAYKVNYEGVKNLLDHLNQQTVLIHISTDYVFDGSANKPYIEEAPTNPINVYGASKLKGEKHLINNARRYYIIRTSWLYAAHGRNFYTFIRDMLSKNLPIRILDTQIGSPTNAKDLAKALAHVILNDKKNYGIYHFSNKDVTNWYIFAKRIIELVDPERLHFLTAIKSFARKAERPMYSKLDVSKFEREFAYTIPAWDESLKEMIEIE